MNARSTKFGSLILVALVTILASFGAEKARAADFCMEPELRKQPIQAEGRVVPLMTYAARIRKSLFPSKTCKDVSATALYCYLSLGKRLEVEAKYGCRVNLKAEHEKTIEILGTPKDEHFASPEIVAAHREQLIAAHQMLQKNNQAESGFGSDIAAVLNRADRLAEIEAGVDWKVLTENHAWTSLRDLSVQPAAATVSDNTNLRATVILSSLSRVTPEEARSLRLETLYESTRPFDVAILFCLVGFILAIMALTVPKFDLWTKVMIGAVFIAQVAGMTLRVMISGRAPVTNMYETVMWVGFGVFALSILLGFRLKDKKLWAVGFAGNSICLFMMMFATRMLDGTIQPLVPVLRDNFWLSTHVTTITLSYACFALGWLISNFVLVRWLFGHRLAESVQKWNTVIRMSIQIGSVFLAAGILLGGIWADYSWGRFWGWDPKETWSLIALVIYAGILHGRYVGWFKDITFSAMGALGFMFVLMAWFGVNYILAVGLHSYGFSSGGSLFLGTIFLSQMVILTLVLFMNLNARKQLAGRA